MGTVIHKKIVMDENNQPVAVQIDYKDWLKIESQLDLNGPLPGAVDLNPFAGKIKLTESPMDYQKRCREEWS